MSDFRPITFSKEYIEQYWEGTQNSIVRYYAYLQRGFGLVNEAKNYAFILLGSFWTAKAITFMGYSINPNWIFVAGLAGLPILVGLGRWDLFKASKSREYINNQHGTVTQYNSYNMQVKTIELLEDLNKNIIQLIDSLKK